MSVIETERLTKRYGSQRGIDDVTVSVEAGEVFGLLGPNGAGKTTLIRTLLDLLHPTSGSARLFGLDSRRDSLAIRRRLGLQALFHQPELLIFDEPTSGLDPLMQEQFLASPASSASAAPPCCCRRTTSTRSSASATASGSSATDG